MKVLPKAPWESQEEAYVDPPRERSRRFPTKVMYMSVVSKPTPTCDGKIFCRRVSETKTTNRVSYNQYFSDDFLTNHMVKSEEWKSLVETEDVDSMQCSDIFSLIGEYYGLSDKVVEKLSFSYYKHSKSGKSNKIIRFSQGPLLDDRVYTDCTGEEHPLFLDQLKLFVCKPRGTEVEYDVSCNSDFMLSTVRDIGRAIRSSYDQVPFGTPIYLILDNAGGHGTSDAKKKFMRILCRKYNIYCIWQVPNSPDTNMLDLGAWAAVQAGVEERHKKLVMRNDVLANSVEQAFEQLDHVKLNKIYDRWLKVLDLIGKSAGGNELVETCRGAQKVEDVSPFNLYGDAEISESESSSVVAIEDETDDDTDTDNSDTDDNGTNSWEVVSFDESVHNSVLNNVEPMTEEDFFGYDRDESDTEVLTHDSEETRLDNEMIYNSLDDETVVIGVGLDHGNNEISDLESDVGDGDD